MASNPATGSIYDDEWYKRNTREDPDDDGSAVLVETRNATRSRDNFTANIAQLRPGNLHAPLVIRNPPPPKLKNEGQWKYIEYIPEWTDPLWHDSKLEIDKNDPQRRLIRPYSVLRHFRPAQLPHDRSQNPTAFALRYGIFPERRDGRSRLTPTRTTFREIQVDGVARGKITGADIAKQAAKYAADIGDGTVEYLLYHYSTMNRTQRDRATPHEAFAIQAMKELQEDEEWQSLMFLGMTTSDLVDEGVLSFSDNDSINLTNDIHEYFARDRWEETTWRGEEEEYPRLVYQAGKRKGEWNARTDDFLWERLQPALKLASRMLFFLEQKHPYWERLMDSFNRAKVPQTRDDRPSEERVRYPAVAFSMQQSEPSLVGDAEVLRMAVDPIEETRKVLRQTTFQITSGYHDQGAADARPTAGHTRIEAHRVMVAIAADLIWPLLVDGYSKHENMMACFMVASTLIHELSHAVSYAHYVWMAEPGPGPLGILNDHPAMQQVIVQAGKEIFGPTDLVLEPFFELEQRTELGYCTENHVFGGVSWPITGASELTPKHLYFLPSGLVAQQWPHGMKRMERPGPRLTAKEPSDLVLQTPPIVADTYETCVKVAQIARFFTEDFWQTEVTRFGSAALRLRSDAPTKVFPPVDETRILATLDLAPSNKSQVFQNYPSGLDEAHPFVDEFLRILGSEYIKTALARFRWGRHFDSWPVRQELIQRQMMQMRLIIDEAAMWVDHEKYRKLLSSERLRTWKTTERNKYLAQVEQFRDELKLVQFQLPAGSERLVNNQYRFWTSVKAQYREADSKIGSFLRTTHEALLHEVFCVQNLFRDIYRMTEKQRNSFIKTERIKPLPSKVKILGELLNDLLDGVEALRREGFSPDIVSEFELKLRTLLQTCNESLRWVERLDMVDPVNWEDLVSLIPGIRKAMRPASMRMVKFAQREIDLMPTDDLQKVQDWLVCLTTNSQAARAAEMINIEVQKDFKASVKKVEEKMRENLDMVDADMDDADSEEDDPPEDNRIRKATLARKASDIDEERSPKRRKHVVSRPLVHPELKHASTMTAFTPPRHNHKYGVPSKHSPKHKLAARSSSKVINAVFANIPSVTFPQTPPQTPPPTVGRPGFAPSTPPPRPPPPESWATNTQTGPQPMELFPHPYALTASFTMDLEHEARALEEAAQQQPAASPLAFTQRPGFDPRRLRTPPPPPPEVPRDPDGSVKTKWQMPDPNAVSPLTPPQRRLPGSNVLLSPLWRAPTDPAGGGNVVAGQATQPQPVQPQPVQQQQQQQQQQQEQQPGRQRQNQNLAGRRIFTFNTRPADPSNEGMDWDTSGRPRRESDDMDIDQGRGI